MLFHQIIYGPIYSRRLGLSLGVNLSPANGKWCNFDCIYCECGWNKDGALDKQLPTTQEVNRALEQKLSELAIQNKLPDVITFSGNGEPSLHPDFKRIIENTVALRNRYAPKAKVCVLSNATQVHRPEVFEALLAADKRILKIDSAFPESVSLIDQPAAGYDLAETIKAIQGFKGDFSLQTIFLRGIYQGMTVNNATAAEREAWIALVKKLHPKEVMIYTIDRPTPAPHLIKVPLPELKAIADEVAALGIAVDIAG
ncbi:MAG: radical SAM protein [Bacteroidales bacterium]|nr:radical SAM protein [Bacteroidales bacterium]